MNDVYRIHPEDSVAVALHPLAPGDTAQGNGFSVDFVEEGAVAVPPVGAVDIAVLQKQLQAVVVDHAAGRPVSHNGLTGQIRNDFFTAVHGGVLLLAGGCGKFLVEIAVEADLVAAPHHFLDH